jgi:uncharacterized repeat protein (TIGR03803 family)
LALSEAALVIRRQNCAYKKTSMKRRKNPLLLHVIILVAGAALSGQVMGEVSAGLHSFSISSGDYLTNQDGAHPEAGVILSGDVFYGTTHDGGSVGNGTVFALNTNGVGFTNLHNFGPGGVGVDGYFHNSDGANPQAGLVLSGNTLYGTALEGGSSGGGTVFSVNTDGTGFTVLHNFSAPDLQTGVSSDGAYPMAELVLSAGILYGTTEAGGGSGNGTVFAVRKDGGAFTNLHHFTTTSTNWAGVSTNSDGARPFGGLVLASNTLYGVATFGGSGGNGAVFKLNTDGTGFRTFHEFTETRTNVSGEYTNNDGIYPLAGLTLSGNTLYGTTSFGGKEGLGTIFAAHTDGTGFTVLHAFMGKYGDGAYAQAELILSGETLYGTAAHGGGSDNGTVFAVNTDGTGYTTLHHFTATEGALYSPNTNSEGAHPYGGLVVSSNTLYGTAYQGGVSGNGTVFRLFFVPQLTIIHSGENAILTWPISYAGFSYAGYYLQTTTNLAAPVVWTPVSPAPVVVNGQNTVTNPISGTKQFYRLNQ